MENTFRANTAAQKPIYLPTGNAPLGNSDFIPSVQKNPPTLLEIWEPLRGLWLLIGVVAGWLLWALPAPWHWGSALLLLSGVLVARTWGSRASVLTGALLEISLLLLCWLDVPTPQPETPGQYRIQIVQKLDSERRLARILASPNPQWVGRFVRCKDGTSHTGEILAGHATVLAPQFAGNLGSFDAPRWAATQDLVGFLQWDKQNPPNRTSLPTPWSSQLEEIIRNHVRTTLQQRLDSGSAALWTTTLLAENGSLPPALEDAFRGSGLYHMLSVSGFHMAVLGAATLALLRLFRTPLRWAWIGAMIVVAGYTLLLHLSPPVLRSAIAFGIMSLAWATGQRAHSGNALCFAAAVLIMLSPNMPFQNGAQLTFAATAGLFWLHPSLRTIFMPQRWERSRWDRWILDPLLVSLSATLATAPILAWMTGSVPWIGIFAGLLGAGLFAAGFLAALAVVAMGALPAWCSSGFIGAAEACARGVLEITAYAGGFSWGQWSLARPTWHWLLWSAVALAIMALLNRPRLRSKCVVLLILWLSLPSLLLGFHSSSNLVLRFWNVGQGDACLVQFPNGQNWLIDAGPRSWQGNGKDAGRDILVPALHLLGIHTLHALVLTHGDLDHYGGAESILKKISVRQILLPDIEDHEENPGWQNFLKFANSQKIPMLRLAAGQILSDHEKLSIHVLAPGKGLFTDERNDGSLVLRIRYDTTAVLMTGDAGFASEAQQLKQAIPLRAQILKISHHGSHTATSLPWLQQVRPQYAILSCGLKNRYGHPHVDVMERLQSQQCRILDTRTGMQTVEILPNGQILAQSGITRWWRGPWQHKSLSL